MFRNRKKNYPCAYLVFSCDVLLFDDINFDNCYQKVPIFRGTPIYTTPSPVAFYCIHREHRGMP